MSTKSNPSSGSGANGVPETTETPHNSIPDNSRSQAGGGSRADWRALLALPGLAAISFYMLVLSAVCIVGVAGGKIAPVYLGFSAIFIAAGLGLLLLLRWAWALVLAAVLLLMIVFLYRFTLQHSPSDVVQSLLNAVFFLYLVRTEVRGKLR